MIVPDEFSRQQLDWISEFAQYVVDHPEVDEILPERSYVYFEVAGEEEFNRYSRELADRQRREEGLPTVLVASRAWRHHRAPGSSIR